MGAGENSALDLKPVSLPAGVSAKMLLDTVPYNAKNPQQNQVLSRAGTEPFLVAVVGCVTLCQGLTCWLPCC